MVGPLTTRITYDRKEDWKVIMTVLEVPMIFDKVEELEPVWDDTRFPAGNKLKKPDPVLPCANKLVSGEFSIVMTK